MLAVVILGLLFGTVVGVRRLMERRDYCLQQATLAGWVDETIRDFERRSASLDPPERPTAIIAGRTYEAADLAAFYAERKQMYLRSAYRPWLALPRRLPPGNLLLRDRVFTNVFQDAGQPLPKSDVSPRS
jgi:hypothetical protein